VNADPVEDSVEADVVLQELHDALTHLRELPFRRAHPLCRRLGLPTPISTADLQQQLLDTIEQLHPPPHVGADLPRWRRYRYLKLRYVEGAGLEGVVAELGISGRQARREHHLALQELAALLLRQSATARGVPAVPVLVDEAVAPEHLHGHEAQAARELAAPAALEAELLPLESAPRIESLDLPAAIEDALGLVSRLAANRSAVVEYVPGGPLPPVVATRTVLRQILLNILSYFINTESTVHLRVTAAETHGGVELHFSPIVPAVGASAAAPARAVAALAPALEAASRLAEGQEGVLQVDGSAARVTTVSLLLLTAQATFVLVVDDNPSLVRLFRRYVRGAGFRLAQARNGIRAQQLARAFQPDVILLDLMMPVQDGWDLFRALQGDAATATIPVVACSILPERELALSLGARDFLAKPVTPESLLAALEPFRRSSRRDPLPDVAAGEHPDLLRDRPWPLRP